MNGNDLLNAMENVDDKHILAAENPRKKRRLLIPVMSAAAAAVIAVTAVGIVNSNRTPSYNENLPKIEAAISVGGMGFEGYSSLEEAENGNPWRENIKLKTLPVYRTNFFEPDHELMMTKLESAVNAIGEDFSKMEIKDSVLTEEKKREITEEFRSKGAPDEEIQYILRSMATQGGQLYASNDDMYMTVRPDYSVSIVYKNGGGIKIPDEYLAAAPEKGKLERMADYVFENFGEIIGIKDPVRIPSYYSPDDSIMFCEGGSNYEEQIFGFNFKNVQMSFDMNENKLRVMHIYTDDGLEKLGDYPLISVKEAKKLLLNGNYLSSQINYAPTEDDPIGKVELKYLAGSGYEFAIPYYRFLVAVDQGDGVTYTAYYVPAVRGEYLKEMPSNLIFNGGIVDSWK